MYGIVRVNPVDPAKMASAEEDLAEFQALHSAQPGYAGSLLMDIGGDRQLVVNLWESEQHARRALPAMVPEVGRVLEPLLTGPSQLVGEGVVLRSDLPGA